MLIDVDFQLDRCRGWIVNSYVYFTNQKSIVNPSSELAIWCIKCNNNDEKWQLTKKNSFYWSRNRRKKFKTAQIPKGSKSPASAPQHWYEWSKKLYFYNSNNNISLATCLEYLVPLPFKLVYTQPSKYVIPEAREKKNYTSRIYIMKTLKPLYFYI